MQLQFNVRNDLWVEMAERRVKKNPPSPVDVTSLLPVATPKAAKGKAMLEFELRKVRAVIVPFDKGRAYVKPDGATSTHWGDNFGIEAHADMFLRDALGRQQIGRAVVTYRLAATVAPDAARLWPRVLDVDIRDLSKLGKVFEPAARKRLEEGLKPDPNDPDDDGSIKIPVAQIVKALGLNPKEHALRNFALAPRPLRGIRKGKPKPEPAFGALVFELDPLQGPWDFDYRFSQVHSGITPRWGELPGNANAGVVIWHDTVITLVEKKIHEFNTKQGIYPTGPIMIHWENTADGHPETALFGVRVDYEAMTQVKGALWEGTFGATLRFRAGNGKPSPYGIGLPNEPGFLYIDVVPHYKMETGVQGGAQVVADYVAKGLAEVFTLGHADTSDEDVPKVFSIGFPTTFDLPMGVFSSDGSLVTRAWAPVKGGYSMGTPTPGKPNFGGLGQPRGGGYVCFGGSLLLK